MDASRRSRVFIVQHVSRFALLVSFVALVGLAMRLSRFASAAFNDPKRLPAPTADSPVRHEPGAEGCSVVVGRMLPEAMRGVAEAHGRSLARTTIIGVYASYDNYAKANGTRPC